MNSSSLYENKIKWGDAFIILYDVNDYTSFEEVTRKLASKVTSGHFDLFLVTLTLNLWSAADRPLPATAGLVDI